jgi:membrane-bound serine protease (ClpP class)
VAGSAFLFRGESWQPAVNPVLALFVSLLLTGFLWVTARKTLEALLSKPAHNLPDLIGAVGETRSPVYQEGSVYVHGELWSARSSRPIDVDIPVRVTQRDGFVLYVEPATQNPVEG